MSTVGLLNVNGRGIGGGEYTTPFTIPLKGVTDLDDRCLTICRKVLKAGTFFLSAWGSTPSIPIGLKFGGNNQAMGYVYVISNLISYTAILTWSYHNIIDNVIGPRAGKVREIEDRTSFTAQVAAKVSFLVLGVIGDFPRAFLAYSYNADSFYAAVLVLFAVAPLSMFSMDLMLQGAMRARQNKLPVEKAIARSKSQLSKAILDYRNHIRDVPTGEAVATELGELTNDPEKVKDVVGKIVDYRAPESTTAKKVAKYATALFGLPVGLVSTISQLIYAFWISKVGMGLATSSEFLQYSASIFIVITKLALAAMVSFGTSLGLFSRVFTNPVKIITGDSLASKIYPKTRAALGLALLVVSGLSIGPLLQTLEDFFDGPFKTVMQVTAPPGILFTFIMAMEDLADKIVYEVGLRFGSEPTKLLIKLDHALSSLDETMKRAAPKNYASFIRMLGEAAAEKVTPEVKNSDNEIVKDLEFNLEILSTYIQEQELLIASDSR